jgi:hypothetical protein
MPDFGIFRGFNDKLFGDKLYAGQLPTQLGIIGSQEVNDFDADALAFFARVFAASGSLSATEQVAIDTLVKELKNKSIWNKLKAIYPMVGASAASCAQNLKSSSFTASFGGGWTFSSTGVTGNGTNTFMNTNLLPNVQMAFNNQSYLFYRGNTNAGGSEFGVNINSNDGIGYFPTLNYTYINTFITGNTGSGGLLPGNYVMTRNGNNLKTFKNNSLINSENTTPTNFTLPAIYLGARNENNSSIRDVSASNFRFFSIGDSLTDQNVTDFYNGVQAFQTTLGRQV